MLQIWLRLVTFYFGRNSSCTNLGETFSTYQLFSQATRMGLHTTWSWPNWWEVTSPVAEERKCYLFISFEQSSRAPSDNQSSSDL